MQSPTLVPARRDEGGVGEGDPEITTADLPGVAHVTVGWFVPTLDGASRFPYFY
jgi:hypothetical protein